MKNRGKILVTGGTGFIGSHLVEMLLENKYDVVCFDRYNPNNHWGWLENSNLKDNIEVVLGDIRDYDSVLKASKGCSAVFHLAALIGIPYSYISPAAYIKTNIEGTYNILEASKTLGLDQVLITSTSEVYGTAQYVPIDEDHLTIGQSPYSASKIAADQLAISYYKSFQLPVKIVRPFNTYGPRQSARAIIPTIFSQLLNGIESLNLGNLTPTRDLTFVNDTCNGFLEIYNNFSNFGEAVNIGTGIEISMRDLVQLIAKVSGKNFKIIQSKERIRPVNSEVDRLVCDWKKLKKCTHWKPKYTLEEGLREVFKWMRNPENLIHYKPKQYNQ